jgi:putative aldouronate transport system permease protein
MPTIAAITLFYAVDRWNEYYNAMLFLNNANLHPLQLLLRSIVMDMSQVLSSSQATMADKFRKIPSASVQMAVVFVAMVPIMLVYPLLQKYFAAGVMIGSLKE